MGTINVTSALNGGNASQTNDSQKGWLLQGASGLNIEKVSDNEYKIAGYDLSIFANSYAGGEKQGNYTVEVGSNGELIFGGNDLAEYANISVTSGDEDYNDSLVFDGIPVKNVETKNGNDKVVFKNGSYSCAESASINTGLGADEVTIEGSGSEKVSVTDEDGVTLNIDSNYCTDNTAIEQPQNNKSTINIFDYNAGSITQTIDILPE